MSRLVDYGEGLIGPTTPPVRTVEEERLYAHQTEQLEAKVRSRAYQLEGHGSGKPKPVRVRMPSGHTFNAGGELLVQALANGAEPVEL